MTATASYRLARIAGGFRLSLSVHRKEDFPHFQEAGNPSIFCDFWPFSGVFSTK